MVLSIAAILGGTLVKVVCPHCRHAQSRKKKPGGEHYRCSECHKDFTAAEGIRLAQGAKG